MSELKHSPLPWKACWYDWAEKNYIDIKVEGDHSHPGIATLSGSYLNSREVEANSLFIVEACNAHYDLTAQLAAKDETISKLREGLEKLERRADRKYKDLTHDDMHGFADIHCQYRNFLRALLAETEVGRDTAHVAKQEVKE